MTKHCLLIDVGGVFYRALHATPRFVRDSDRVQVGAAIGFFHMTEKIIRQQVATRGVTHVCICFDSPGKNFRHEIYPAYKGNRPPTPKEVTAQLEMVRVAVASAGIAACHRRGFEADDIVASVAAWNANRGWHTTIVSSDKDIIQLMDEKTSFYDTMSNKILDENAVVTKFGVPPSLFLDFQALAGDTVDNIPGVPSIGPKTAAKLINEFGSLEAVIEKRDDIKPRYVGTVIGLHQNSAVMSKRLAALKRDIDVWPDFTSLQSLDAVVKRMTDTAKRHFS